LLSIESILTSDVWSYTKTVDPNIVNLHLSLSEPVALAAVMDAVLAVASVCLVAVQRPAVSVLPEDDNPVALQSGVPALVYRLGVDDAVDNSRAPSTRDHSIPRCNRLIRAHARRQSLRIPPV